MNIEIKIKIKKTVSILFVFSTVFGVGTCSVLELFVSAIAPHGYIMHFHAVVIALNF